MSCVTIEANGSPHSFCLTLWIDLLNDKIHHLCNAFVSSMHTVPDNVEALNRLIVPHHTAEEVTGRFHSSRIGT